jgi:hypothetical protein
MRTIRLGLGVFLFLLSFASASLAAGTATRTFVSGKGLDSNPCTLASPCRTFAVAVPQTISGGEVVVLDSAGYGPFSISQSVTVTAPQGVYAGVTVSSAGGDGIDVNASSASDFVTLKGLTVIGPGASTSTGNGIAFNSGAALHIENCDVRGFNIDILANLCAQLFIKDTVVKDSHFAGIDVTMVATGNSWATLDHISATNCGTNGVLASVSGAGLFLNAQIRDSTISGNSNGLVVNGLNNAIATLDVANCQIANGAVGIQSLASGGGSGTMSIGNTLISHNSTAGFIINGGTIQTLGTNTLIGNGPDTGSMMHFAAQ